VVVIPENQESLVSWYAVAGLYPPTKLLKHQLTNILLSLSGFQYVLQVGLNDFKYPRWPNVQEGPGDPLSDDQEVAPWFVPTLCEFDGIGVTKFFDDFAKICHNGEVLRILSLVVVVFCSVPPLPAFFAGDNEAANNLSLEPRFARLIRLGSVPRGWVGIKGVIECQGGILRIWWYGGECRCGGDGGWVHGGGEFGHRNRLVKGHGG